METSHKNKTLATFLASTLGGLGAHRFYLHGMKDGWGWFHFFSAPLSIFLIALNQQTAPFFLAAPFMMSVLIGFIEAMSLGLTPDEKWDARHNRHSTRTSSSGWFIAILLVLTVGIGATLAIALLARTLDLLYSGGAYG